jgi:hypothetical protein
MKFVVSILFLYVVPLYGQTKSLDVELVLKNIGQVRLHGIKHPLGTYYDGVDKKVKPKRSRDIDKVECILNQKAYWFQNVKKIVYHPIEINCSLEADKDGLKNGLYCEPYRPGVLEKGLGFFWIHPQGYFILLLPEVDEVKTNLKNFDTQLLFKVIRKLNSKDDFKYNFINEKIVAALGEEPIPPSPELKSCTH